MKTPKKGCQKHQGERYPKYTASEAPGGMGGIRDAREEDVRQYQGVGGANRKRASKAAGKRCTAI